MSGVKLTKAQRRELEHLATKDGRIHYADHYAPIKALLAAGLVDREQGRFGGSLYAITPAGRAALSTKTEGAE